MKSALVIGGTGPTGPYIIEGLVARGYTPTVLHRGVHEVDHGADIEHVHVDPHFGETLAAGVQGRKYDLVVATYGRLRLFMDVLDGVTERLITIGGTAYRDLQARWATEHSPRYVENKIVSRIVETEQVLRDAHAAGRYNITHLRYPNLYGPRQLGPREWSIIRRIQDGRRQIPVLNGGLSLESRAYVENAAHAVLLAVDDPRASAGQQYNVADEYTPPDAVRVRAIAAVMGVEVELANFPERAGAPAYWWGNGRDLDFVREGRAPQTHHKLISVKKITDELGYQDVVGFDVAIRRTTQWYLANPLERGGAEEAQIGDPFDYAAEDAYLAALEDMVRVVVAIPFGGVDYAHPYAHPVTPMDVPKLAGGT